MATLRHQCPNCLVSDIALSVVHCSPTTEQHQIIQTEGYVSLKCPRCLKPSGARSDSDVQFMVSMSQMLGDPTTQGWRIVQFWPEVRKPQIPEFLPPDIERAYLQAERNFPIEGNEEAAGTMYRKALDVGLKKIDSTLTGPLGAKLKTLAAQGKLTPDVADWADHVRELGNDAAHEESGIPRKDLEDLRGLTEMVLRYLFTLPNMSKKRRGEKLPWET
jgi:hypothetical protein